MIPILWPPDTKSLLIGKDPDAGNDWRQEKGMTEDEMVGWHHQLKWTWIWVNYRVGDGQWGLVCRSPWHGIAKSWTWLSNWTELSFSIFISSGHMPSSGNAGAYGGFIPNFFFNEFSPQTVYTFSFLKMLIKIWEKINSDKQVSVLSILEIHIFSLPLFPQCLFTK